MKLYYYVPIAKKLNDTVVIFAKAYVKMLSLNKEEENCRIRLK